MSRLSRLLICALIPAAFLQACSSIQGAAPWEREYLAQSSMIIDNSSLDHRNLEHIFFSREGSAGGWGIGGGGCGCN